MAMEMRQQMKMSQQLVMTPQLQQAIKLLQLTRAELCDVVQKELEENPLLEEGDAYKEPEAVSAIEADEAEVSFMPEDAGEEYREWDEHTDGYVHTLGEHSGSRLEGEQGPETRLARRESLADHLSWQLVMGACPERLRQPCLDIIGNIDDAGYLQADLGELARAVRKSIRSYEQALAVVQTFDPPGVGARNLRECLLLQLRHQGLETALAASILADHMKDLEYRKYHQIARTLGVDIDQVVAAAEVIARLDPKPGRAYAADDIHYVVPDIYVTRAGDEFVVMLNDEGMPQLRISDAYADIAPAAGVAQYIGEKHRAALWLIKSIQQRQRTIYKVAKSIVKFQHEFFDSGIDHLRPLVLRDVAEDIGMHESTVSRVTTNKYMQTPQGLLELKFFFNSGLASGDGVQVASESVKNRIREIIVREDNRRPLSDQRIAEQLSEDSIRIARRTVTKYRELLGLGSSAERKRHY